MLEDVLQLSQELGNKYCETITLTRLAKRAWSEADVGTAESLFRRAASLASRLGDDRILSQSLQGLADSAIAQGNMPRAARLLGARQSASRVARSGSMPDGAVDDENVMTVRDALGEARFLTEWMAGQGMDREETARYAAEGLG